jgi:ABC-type transport system involved in multi-copper enzyme maturation permease subunit
MVIRGNTIGGLFFVSFVTEFLNSSFIVMFIVLFTVAGIVGSTMKEKTINHEVIRTGSRNRVIYSKIVVIYSCIAIYLLCLNLFSVSFYWLLARNGKNYNPNLFHQVGSNFFDYMLSIFLLMIFIASIALLLSLFFNPSIMMIITFIISIISKILENIDVIDTFMPFHLASGDLILNPEWTHTDLIRNAAIFFIYIVIINFIAIKIFQRKEL